MPNERRIKKLRLNSISALVLQVVTALSGIILPKAMLSAYGSEVNGLVASINQFLGYIALIEAGLGSVARAELYTPLARRDSEGISLILKASRSFFRKIAITLVLYVLLVASTFPFLKTFENFSSQFVFFIVIVLGINSFMQYYFAMTYQILLQADQRAYILNAVHICSLLLNVIAVLVMISCGYNILVVKITTAAVYLIKPIAFSFYVKKKYKINFKVHSDKPVLKQRWDGMIHHIAYFVHQNTDIAILTFFLNLKEVSVYSLYSAVTIGVRSIVSAACSGAEAAIGNIQAEGDKNELNSFVNRYEMIMFFVGTVIFSVTLSMIPSFVDLYVGNVGDVIYYRRGFAIFLVLAEYMYIIRQPYSNVINSKGHFKQTKAAALTEMLINLFISIILVRKIGLTGVAIGTFVAMSYRTIYNVLYIKNNIMYRKLRCFARNILMAIPNFVCVYALYDYVEKYVNGSMINWFACATVMTLFSLVLQFVIMSAFNKEFSSFIKKHIRKGRKQQT